MIVINKHCKIISSIDTVKTDCEGETNKRERERETERKRRSNEDVLGMVRQGART